MNKTHLISYDTLKIIGQGIVGSMTFGIYHQYTTNIIMELNNQKQNLQYKLDMLYKTNMKLNNKIEKLEKLKKLEKLEKIQENKKIMNNN